MKTKMINTRATRKTKVMQVAFMILAMLTMSCKKQDQPEIIEKVKVRLVIKATNVIMCDWGTSTRELKNGVLNKNVVNISGDYARSVGVDTTFFLDRDLFLSVRLELKDLPEVQFNSIVQVYKNGAIIKELNNRSDVNLAVYFNK